MHLDLKIKLIDRLKEICEVGWWCFYAMQNDIMVSLLGTPKLMTNLQSTAPHFVRYINPDVNKIAGNN